MNCRTCYRSLLAGLFVVAQASIVAAQPESAVRAIAEGDRRLAQGDFQSRCSTLTRQCSAPKFRLEAVQSTGRTS